LNAVAPAGLTARGSEASAKAAVPAKESLIRLEFFKKTRSSNQTKIQLPYCDDGNPLAMVVYRIADMSGLSGNAVASNRKAGHKIDPSASPVTQHAWDAQQVD